MNRLENISAKIRLASLVTTILAMPFIPSVIYGDDVPHPTVHIQVFYDHQPLSEKRFYGRMLERSKSEKTVDVFQDSSGDPVIDKCLAMTTYDSVHACFWRFGKKERTLF